MPSRLPADISTLLGSGHFNFAVTLGVRGDLIRRVLEKRLKQAQAAEILGMSVRQVKRLCRAFKREGLAGLASKKRGRPSNRRLKPELQVRAVAIVRERYHDFGPKLAHEKLLELHDLRVGRETLRKWLVAAGVWQTRAQRLPKAHQPRNRRQRLSELVQIDGCDHEWFEARGNKGTSLLGLNSGYRSKVQIGLLTRPPRRRRRRSRQLVRSRGLSRGSR
jgi:transposase